MAEAKPRISKAWVIGLIQLAFVIGIISIALILSSRLNSGGTSEPVDLSELQVTDGISVRVVSPDPRSYTPRLRLNGTVQAQAEVSVSPQVSGEISRVGAAFKPGSLLPEGTLLFAIDRSDFELAVDRAQAEIAAAKSDLAQLEAEALLAREEWNELFPGREITDLAARVPQIDAAKARLLSAEANKRTAQLSLQRTEVHAPFDARVLSTALDRGQIVSPGQIVGRLVSLDSIEVIVPASADQLNILAPIEGRTVILEPRGKDKNLTGEVVRIDATLDARTRLSRLYVAPELSADLTIGDFVDVTIQSEPIDDALLIPASALFAQNKVWVVEGDVLVSRIVSVLSDDDNGLTIAGIDIGDGIVALPPSDAFEGMSVRIREADTEAAGGDDNAAR
jgi:RND family efflux transporter MFP subunit